MKRITKEGKATITHHILCSTKTTGASWRAPCAASSWQYGDWKSNCCAENLPGWLSPVLLTQHLRQEVAKLASDYHLEVGEQNLTRTIMSEFSLLWSDLEDARPQKLRAYGA